MTGANAVTDSSSQTKAGLFVSLGLLLLAASILFFGGSSFIFKKYTHYKVRLSTTQGLTEGSVISLAGVEVGHIQKINFTNENKLEATISVEQRFTNLLSENSVASVRTQGALGDKYIFITVGAPANTPLAAGDFIKSEDSSDIIDMLSSKLGALSSAADTIKELNLFFHNLNADGKSAFLTENILEATKNIANLTRDSNMHAAISSLKNILLKIDSGEGTLGKLINDPTIHNRLVNLIGDAPRNQFLKPLLRETIKQNEQKH